MLAGLYAASCDHQHLLSRSHERLLLYLNNAAAREGSCSLLHRRKAWAERKPCVFSHVSSCVQPLKVFEDATDGWNWEASPQLSRQKPACVFLSVYYKSQPILKEMNTCAFVTTSLLMSVPDKVGGNTPFYLLSLYLMKISSTFEIEIQALVHRDKIAGFKHLAVRKINILPNIFPPWCLLIFILSVLS